MNEVSDKHIYYTTRMHPVKTTLGISVGNDIVVNVSSTTMCTNSDELL